MAVSRRAADTSQAPLDRLPSLLLSLLLPGQLGDPAAHHARTTVSSTQREGKPVPEDRVNRFATAAVVCAVAGFTVGTG
jgi:hypothetical protein